ncbi:MAG: alanine racemase [Phycisphaeraceae bacterium]
MTQLTRKLALERPVRLEAPDRTDNSFLQISLTRLDHNLDAIRHTIRRPDRFSDTQPMVCGVIKSNAYGLGAVPIAKRLADRGIDMLAVYSVREAEQLIHNAVTCPILLLMPLRDLGRNDPLYRTATAGRLHLSIHDAEQLNQVNHFGRVLDLKMPVHLYYDTGMSRSGLNRQELADALARMPELPHVQLAGLFTHLATADNDETFTNEQLEMFDHALAEHNDQLPDSAVVHVGNTFATLRDRRYHRDMVRVGLGLFGYGPDLLTGGSLIANAEPLLPIVRWVSRINHVQKYPKGTPVSYGATYRLQRDSVLGVVPVGYGNGYPLSLSNRGRVGLPDLRTGPQHITANVLGRVTMDQIVIDLTDALGSADPTPVRLMNSTVELISDDPTSPCALPRLAEAAGSHCYEMLCRLSPDLPRHYLTTDAQNTQKVKSDE